MQTTTSKEFWKGVKAELPLLIGVIPFGLIFGVLAISAGIPAGTAQAMSAVIFAGSAQFVTTQLYAAGTPTLVILLTIAVINLRHALYSASIAPYFKALKTIWRWLLAYLLTDEAYAVSIIHYQQTDLQHSNAEKAAETADNRHYYFLGAGLTLWLLWQLSTAAGILLGAIIPQSWSLDFALALTLLAIIVPTIKDRPTLASGLSAGALGVLLVGMPLNLGLVVASLIGILVGSWLERRA